MHTKSSVTGIKTAHTQKAESILRSCVHCGFCLSTCPTYQLTGNESDSPRGRIYLIKSVLEDNEFSANTIYHLDRCLTCRACETTCPSGVKYGELADIGREMIERKRPLWQKALRTSVRKLLTTPSLVNIVAPFVKHATIQTPSVQQNGTKGRILLLSGCIQPVFTPNTNHATTNVLTTLGYEIVETTQKDCCGAVDHHLSAQGEALIKVKRNIDQWLSMLDSGVDTIISTASGCGLMVKDYPTLFEADDTYYQKALSVAAKTKDIAEFLLEQDLSLLTVANEKISYQAPCSLQHGQKLPNLVEGLLEKLGYELKPVIDSHLCCGSAGTYSLFQPEMARQLRDNKINNLSRSLPDLIVTSNIGCQIHLAKGTKLPVKHWIELLDN
jgi:glycolate oxidase iron-sulfur subunit